MHCPGGPWRPAPRGLMGGGGYVPRFRNLDKREKNFIRGLCLRFRHRRHAESAAFPAIRRGVAKAARRSERRRLRHDRAWATVLPRYEHHVRINKDVKDAWGIPALHIQQKYTDNEFAMAKDAMQMAEELCHGAGFEVMAKHWEMVPPGESIHELGTCRMGADPKTSVLNKYNQCHDVKNLFVMDGSSFIFGGSQNPTLTILALAMRAIRIYGRTDARREHMSRVLILLALLRLAAPEPRAADSLQP